MTECTRYRIEAITYLWKLQCRFPDKPSGLRTIFHDLTSSQNPSFPGILAEAYIIDSKVFFGATAILSDLK